MCSNVFFQRNKEKIMIDCGEANGNELDQRVIRVWKYVRMGINAYLKNQVENHSKIDNDGNNQKYEISKSNFSKSWKEKRDNIIPPTKLFPLSLHQLNLLSFPMKLPLFFQYVKVSDQFASFVHL